MGEEAGLPAGLEAVFKVTLGVTVMDADLQDPPELLYRNVCQNPKKVTTLSGQDRYPDRKGEVLFVHSLQGPSIG